MKFIQKTNLAIAVLFSPLLAHASCGGAFCNLSTDWDAQGVTSKPGIRLDLRAEFIDLNHLRGTSVTDPAGEEEAHSEVRTINRNLLASLDWNINPTWGMTFKVPLLSRAHTHVSSEDDGGGGTTQEIEKWNFSGLGDVQALARYRFYADKDSNAGLRFGLKFPTGSINKRNSEDKAERMLQPGTGSLDTLLGAYYNVHKGNTTWFVQGMWQQPVHERDNFKPGTKLSTDVGLNYSAAPNFSLMLQLNAQHKSRDSGANAEPANSGGDSINISPGISYHLAAGTQIYGFLQKPIYQYVNGGQLTASWSVAVGLSTEF